MDTVQRPEDVFQTLILREFVLADGLQTDVQMAKVAAWIGPLIAQPAAVAINVFVTTTFRGNVKLPPGLTKTAIIALFSQANMLYAVRVTRGFWQRLFGSKEKTAHSYCRSALCYAVQGNYQEAQSWLQAAESLVDDLARPRFIRGLMLGAQGNSKQALNELRRAENGRAKKETRERLAEMVATAMEAVE